MRTTILKYFQNVFSLRFPLHACLDMSELSLCLPPCTSIRPARIQYIYIPCFLNLTCHCFYLLHQAEKLRRDAHEKVGPDGAPGAPAEHAGVSGTAAAFHGGQDAEPHQGMEYTANLPTGVAAMYVYVSRSYLVHAFYLYK